MLKKLKPDIVEIMTARPLDWISEIETSLARLDEKPQFGSAKPFDWLKLESDIQHVLRTRDLKLTHTVRGWVASNEIVAGLNGQMRTLAIEWGPLKTPALFITNQQSLKDLMAQLFSSEEAGNFFYESTYVEAFYNYFAVEMLRIIEQQEFAAPLTPTLGNPPQRIQDAIGEESCFVVDLNLSFGPKNYWGRAVLTESFRKEWKAFFASQGPQKLSEEMKEKLQVELCLEVAHAHLTLADWKKVKTGDLVVLDHCSYDPQEHKGAAVLTLNQKPVFRGRFKDGGIKITNYPIYGEASEDMDDETFKRKFDEGDEDEDVYGDLGEDSDFGEDEDEDDDIFAGLEPRKTAPAKEQESDTEHTAETRESEEQRTPITPEELPVHLTVEVGRVQMTAGALMNLSPGNLLELNVSPEQGVDLVVNGKRVGRGELIRIGDILGVRILSL